MAKVSSDGNMPEKRKKTEEEFAARFSNQQESVRSHLKKASWAIYLRHKCQVTRQRQRELEEKHRQMVEALERHNARAFVKTVAQDLTSREVQIFFQQHPFSSSLVEDEIPPVDSPFAFEFLVEIAFPLAAADPSPYLRDLGSRARDLWHEKGLGAVVQKAHCKWRQAYVDRTHRIINSLLQDSSEKCLKVARELYSCTELGSPNRNPFFPSVHPILEELYVSPERASRDFIEGITSTWDRDVFLHEQLDAKQIREVFPVEEEAMVLTIVRKHMVHRFGRRVFNVLPIDDIPSMDNEEHSDDAVPGMPHILDAAEDVVADMNLWLQDVSYYRKLRQMLIRFDTLAEASVFRDTCDVFSIPLPPEKKKAPQCSENQVSGSGCSKETSIHREW